VLQRDAKSPDWMWFASLADSSPTTSASAATCGGREVFPMNGEALVVLVIGVASLMVAIVGLVIKLVELGRK